jgi:hypothetical protein
MRLVIEQNSATCVKHEHGARILETVHSERLRAQLLDGESTRKWAVPN